MKTEQSAFAKRLLAALGAAGIEASPALLEKLVPKYGGEAVTSQAVSGWLTGKHLPKQANMQALAHIVGVPPHELQFGTSAHKGVREANLAWPDHVRGHDRLAFEAFLALPEGRRKLVRELIAVLGTPIPKRPA
ncbi:transcriptional regulator [Rhodanobacter sp. 7MK24]|uniref:transcriptional regulator n=1 Tax=Rhodanobacter sp. 7MK24 TaxID=2775922 RepID=UPI0017823D69|nr:transcriptional regulator [Rhodanobacter sp. 7MK24]MBD8879236.1 transcriptional regulator [Rhodanobacter sp. 7MK24]